MVGMHDIDVLQLSLLEIFYRILQVCSLAPWQRVLQGMANRGGARHFAKSVVEGRSFEKGVERLREHCLRLQRLRDSESKQWL